MSKELMTASECIVKYGLDWQVEARPITVQGKEGAEDNYQAIVRSDTQHVFQIARDRYFPVQNTEAFTFFDEIVQTGQAKYEKAQSFKHGAVLSILAKMPYSFEVVKGDKLDTYLRLTTSHDGSQRLSIAPYVYRQVCSNGMHAWVEDATKKIAVKHTENAKNKFIFNAKRVLEKEIDYFKRFSEHCKSLASRQMNELAIDSFLHKLFNVDSEKELSTRTANQIEAIKDLHYKGRGTDISGVKNTAWGMYNAVTEYIDHERSTKGEDDNRMYSSLFGSGSQMREKAFSLLLDK